MKKIRLLQIAVYIAFAAFFLQDAGIDVYRGLSDGFMDAVGASHTESSLSQPVCIDAVSIPELKGNKLLINSNYALEDISLYANMRPKHEAARPQWWFVIIRVSLSFGLVFLLLKTAYIINNIIYNIARGHMFRKEAVRSMREIGVLLILYFAADYIYQQVLYLESIKLVSLPLKIINTSGFNFETLICGLLALIIADAFKEAAKLKEEQELTI